MEPSILCYTAYSYKASGGLGVNNEMTVSADQTARNDQQDMWNIFNKA